MKDKQINQAIIDTLLKERKRDKVPKESVNIKNIFVLFPFGKNKKRENIVITKNPAKTFGWENVAYGLKTS